MFIGCAEFERQKRTCGVQSEMDMLGIDEPTEDGGLAVGNRNHTVILSRFRRLANNQLGLRKRKLPRRSAHSAVTVNSSCDTPSTCAAVSVGCCSAKAIKSAKSQR